MADILQSPLTAMSGWIPALLYNPRFVTMTRALVHLRHQRTTPRQFLHRPATGPRSSGPNWPEGHARDNIQVLASFKRWHLALSSRHTRAPETNPADLIFSRIFVATLSRKPFETTSLASGTFSQFLKRQNNLRCSSSVVKEVIRGIVAFMHWNMK